MEPEAPVTPARWIRMGWQIVRADLGKFVLISVVALALTMAGTFVVAGPLLAGMFIALRRSIVEGRTEFMDVFTGFNTFIDSFLVYIISSVFILIGVILFVFPGLVVLTFYAFAFVFVIDRKLGFWDALESSRRLTLQNLFGYLLFSILLLLLNLLGLIALGVGVLITLPVSVAAISVAYNEKVGYSQQPQPAAGPVMIP